MAAITLLQQNPSNYQQNTWSAGNSWAMLQNVYNDIVSLNIVAASVTGNNVFTKPIIQSNTAVAINSTGAGTLAVVTSGVLAGRITSTSAAAVALTLDSVANIVAAAAVLGVTLGAGSELYFWVDNTAGANTITVAVDSGATIAVITPAITGGATLTVSTANAVAKFCLYLTSTTAAKLLRLV